MLIGALCILVASIASIATAQDKQAIAVYMAGEEPEGAAGVHKVMGGELARTISQSAKYSAIDRTEAILRQLSTEHEFQRSGAVSNEQIKNLGKQLGVQYLCIADISAVGSAGLMGGRSYYLDVRLIDVVTAEIQRTVTEGSSLKNATEMMQVARKIAYELIETEKVKEQRQLSEDKRAQTKKTLFYTAIGLETIGAGLLAYGLWENNAMGKQIRDTQFTGAQIAERNRNLAYGFGIGLLLSGITIHIFF
jgi:hypothetical protein